QRRECGYMDALTQEDVLEAERLLAKVVELAQTEKQKQRARFFHDYFTMAKKRFILPYLAHAEMSTNRPQAKRERAMFLDDFDKPRPGVNPRLQGWGSWKRTYSKAKCFHDENEGHLRGDITKSCVSTKRAYPPGVHPLCCPDAGAKGEYARGPI
ncbi:MAG: hypothetical protein KAI66_22700, partial [Lentisphaeria bacterium]|nr:hypothetical protein [Lentisphaeria bacterium]